MRADILNTILSDLKGSSPDIEACCGISTDGLMIASFLPTTMDEDPIGTMSAAMISLGDRTSHDIARDVLEQIPIKADSGHVLLTYASGDSVLTVLAKPYASLSLIFPDVKRAWKNIIELM
ncbi:MAG: roadblock/LC7 domain-containing protein [Methylobacter sp.]